MPCERLKNEPPGSTRGCVDFENRQVHPISDCTLDALDAPHWRSDRWDSCQDGEGLPGNGAVYRGNPWNDHTDGLFKKIIRAMELSQRMFVHSVLRMLSVYGSLHQCRIC